MIGLLLFGLGLFMIGERRLLFEDSFEIYTEFATMGGLQDGASVRVAGMNAGQVLGIEAPPGPASRFRVKVRVVEELHPLVRTDSVASIQSDGLIGNTFLQISPGTDQAPPAPAESTLPSREPFALGDLLEQISDTVDSIDNTVVEVRAEVQGVVTGISETADEISLLVEDVGEDIKAITVAGNRISQDIEFIVAGVKSGEGTMGRLVRDDALYNELTAVARQAQAVAENTREVTERVRDVVSQVQDSEIVSETEQAVRNVNEVTGQARDTLAGFAEKNEAGQGMGQDLRLTLQYAREAMNNLAENLASLRQNWFFRGLFKDRGFYDLGALTVEAYRDGILEKDRRVIRRWIRAEELFSSEPDGSENLTDEGRKRLDSVMAEFLRYASDNPLMVEGYASAPSRDEQFLLARRRAAVVREYVVQRFFLDRNYTGFIPMGELAPDSPSGDRWEGVALALFVHKDAQPGP